MCRIRNRHVPPALEPGSLANLGTSDLPPDTVGIRAGYHSMRGGM